MPIKQAIRRYAMLTLVIGLLLRSGGVWACMPPIYDKPQTPAQKLNDAKAGIARAVAIIDAEVVRTGGYDNGAALLYAHRILRGPQDRWYEVGTNGRDSCAIEFKRVGERMRLFIFKGPHGFFIADPFVDERYVDKLLGSNRKKDYPYFGGAARP